MTNILRRARFWLAAVCLVTMVCGQTTFLPSQASAAGQVGRPPLPPGIERLPFDGEEEITQVPGCGSHASDDPNNLASDEAMALNSRAFDFGLINEPVVAAGSGTVTTYTDAYGALVLVIDHGQGVRSYYVHLSEYLVADGQEVHTGDVIAISGSTGLGGQPHLHFAVTVNGEAANINSLPGIPWDEEHLNEDGFAICNPNAHDWAVGGPIEEAAEGPNETDLGDHPLVVSYVYDRDAALDAAFENLDAPYEYDWDAAMYVSKVLWAGGLEWTDTWANEAVYDPDVLVDYLLDNYLATKTSVDWSDNSVAGAQLADVIAYDWEGDGVIDHVAVVTGRDEKDQPLVSEHSPTTRNRFWSWSDTDEMFFEEAYPSSQAYLIAISPMTIPEV